MRTHTSLRTACVAGILLMAASLAAAQTAAPAAPPAPPAAPAAQPATVPAAAPAAPAAAPATVPAATPIAFEVASIKPSPPIDPMQIMSGTAHVGMHINAARVDFGYTPLKQLIVSAYKVKGYQVTGPTWLNTTMFDIVAKLPEGATKEQIPEMLQALLAERFKMTIHRETKDHSEFSLVVAKGGAKLKEAEPLSEAEAAAAEEPPKPGEMSTDTPEGRMRMKVGKDGMRYTGPGTDVAVSFANGTLHMDATRLTMKGLAELISQFAGNPVVDNTELKGTYQLVFDFSMDEMMAMARASGAMPGQGPAAAPGQGPANAASDPSGPSVTAMVQKYGLKLTPQKVPVEFIVVDHIEKTPTEN
jgi:uncharacterized protein (TIGR03435 family)